MVSVPSSDNTRGRILVLLARDPSTVAALAERLEISASAVRQHMATLERDGAVERAGAVSTGGKPAALFRLSAAGENVFPKAYAEVLAAIADEVIEQFPADAERLFTAGGVRLARMVAGGAGAMRGAGADGAAEAAGAADAGDVRLQAAIDALTALGALADVEHREDGSLLLQGHACPLSDVVTSRPLLCHMLAVMTEHISGLEVEHRCDYTGPRPRCRFVLSVAAAA